MPFQSEAQRRYLWANEPEIARDWADTYGSKIQAADGGIMRLPFAEGDIVDDQGNVFEETEYTDLTQEQFDERFGGEYEENLTPWYQEDTLQKMWNDPDRPQISKGLGTMKDWATDKIGSGYNWTKKLPSMAMGALSGVPGLGFLMNSMRSDPRDKYLGDPYSMQNYTGKDYGYGNALRHGNLTGQDQFGINTRSLLGDYQGHYGNFMNEYAAGNIKKNKFNRNKFAFAQDVTGTADDSSNITGTPLITQTSIHRGGGNQGNGGAAAQAAGDLAGGRATWGVSPFQRGGIAGLWPR